MVFKVKFNISPRVKFIVTTSDDNGFIVSTSGDNGFIVSTSDDNSVLFVIFEAFSWKKTMTMNPLSFTSGDNGFF